MSKSRFRSSKKYTNTFLKSVSKNVIQSYWLYVPAAHIQIRLDLRQLIGSIDQMLYQ